MIRLATRLELKHSSTVSTQPTFGDPGSSHMDLLELPPPPPLLPTYDGQAGKACLC
jgi:hypothetical protein